MNRRPTNRKALIGTAVAAGLVAAGLGASFAFTPKAKWPEPIPGRPLLQQDSDEDLPTVRSASSSPRRGAWSMQVRSTESPHEHKPERTVVKYKRLIPGLEVAWLKVSVADASGDESPADLLKKRKVPEDDWKVIKPIEDGLTVGGRPAARITFGGPFDPDQKGTRDFTSEVVAVRRGPQMFYFAGTYATADPKGQKRVRTALDSAIFDPDRFAATP